MNIKFFLYSKINEISKELTTTEIINDIIKKIEELKVRLNLPKSLKEINIPNSCVHFYIEGNDCPNLSRIIFTYGVDFNIINNIS